MQGVTSPLRESSTLQGSSQDYTKGVLNSVDPCSVHIDSLTDKTIGHKRWRAPSRIWLFTLYCKSKVISYVCIVAYWTLRANACCCSCSLVVTMLKLRTIYIYIYIYSARTWLANYLNPVAKYYIWYLILHMKVAEESCCSSACDHETWPAIGYIIVQIDGLLFQGFHCPSLDKRLFTTHTVSYSAHSSICCSHIQNWN